MQFSSSHVVLSWNMHMLFRLNLLRHHIILSVPNLSLCQLITHEPMSATVTCTMSGTMLITGVVLFERGKSVHSINEIFYCRNLTNVNWYQTRCGWQFYLFAGLHSSTSCVLCSPTAGERNSQLYFFFGGLSPTAQRWTHWLKELVTH